MMRQIDSMHFVHINMLPPRSLGVVRFSDTMLDAPQLVVTGGTC